MSVLRFRRDRRQRDPFAGTPLDREPAPAGWNAGGWPLVRDAIGVRPATGGEMHAPRLTGPHDVTPVQILAAQEYDTRIDVDATLAGIAAQAEAEARAQTETFASAAPAGRHAQPPWPPAADPASPDLLADRAHAFYGWDITAMDVPPHHDRPYIPGVLGAEGRLTPRHAGVSDDLGSLPLFRDAVRRIGRPACEQCQQATGTWQERLYGTFIHHTRPVDEAGPRQFGIATELRQVHGETAADADDAEAAFTRRYLTRRAA